MKYLLLLLGFWSMNGCNAIFRRDWAEIVLTLIGMLFVFVSGFLFTIDAREKPTGGRTEG